MIRGLLLAAFVVTMVGCGGSGRKAPELLPIEVIVTINGQPLPNAQVTFTPVDTAYGTDAISMGVTDDTGRAKLAVGSKPGACFGKNRVTVSEGPAPEDTRSDDPQAQVRQAQHLRSLKNRPIPQKYSVVVTADLTIDVTKTQTEYKVELVR